MAKDDYAFKVWAFHSEYKLCHNGEDMNLIKKIRMVRIPYQWIKTRRMIIFQSKSTIDLYDAIIHVIRAQKSLRLISVFVGSK